MATKQDLIFHSIVHMLDRRSGQFRAIYQTEPASQISRFVERRIFDLLMRLLTGDETGLVKGVYVYDGGVAKPQAKIGTQTKDNEVRGLCWTASDEAHLLCAHKNKVVQVSSAQFLPSSQFEFSSISSTQ
jgi:hypothetical protein